MRRSAAKSVPNAVQPAESHPAPRPLRRLLGACALALAVSAPAHAAINVNKTFTPDAVAAGQPSKVTFYFLNNNIVDATSVQFVDPLPSPMQVAPTPNAVSNCGGTLTAVPGATSVSFTGGTVPKAVGTTPGQCELSFDVIVATANVLINSVPAGEVTTSQGPNSQAAEATLNVTGLAPIVGQKVFSPTFVHGYLPQNSTPIPAGGKSSVTITLNNPNGVALTNVTFTDNLPSTTHPSSPVAAGGLVVSPIPNGSTTCGGTFVPVAGAKSVTLTGGTIPALGSCNVKFDVVAESPAVNAQGNVTNAIPAGGVTTYEGPTNATFSAQINRQTGANLGKSFSPSTIANNGTSLLTITVRNYTASPLNNIGFTDNLPAGMEIATPAQPAFAAGDCQFASSTVASGFSVTALPDGTSIGVSGGSLVAAPNSANPAQCTIRVNVTANNAGTTNLTLANTILTGTWDGTFPYPAASANLIVQPTSRITGTKSFNPGTVFQGQASLATVVLTNDSGVALTSFGFVDNVNSTMGGAPGSVKLAAAPAPTNDCGMTAVIDGSSNVITFTGGSLAAGASCTITFPVQTFNNTATGNRTNTIAVNAVTGTPPAGDPVKNLIAIAGTLVVTAPATASKGFSPSSVPAGTDSLLTITVNRPNNAPAWANFTITDNLPAGHTISPVVATPAGTACVGTLTAPSGGTTIQFASTTPPANNAFCTIRVNVRTPAGSAGVATNTITPGQFVVSYVGGGSYSNNANITANITRVTASVTLTKSFDPAVVDLMGTSTMFLRIVNTAGNAINLTGVNLEDHLPAGLVLAAVPNPQFTGTGCSLGTLVATPGDNKVTLTNASVNANRICTIQVLTQALAAGNLINQVPAGALTTTQNVSNLEPVAATITSTGLSHLTITKDDGVAEIKAGGTTTYTVVVTNADLANVAAVAGATFTDTPPAGMTFTSWSCVPSAGAVCTANGTGPIVDSVTIPKGGSITYTIQALLAADYASSTVKNCAKIEPPASVIDDLSDNEACDTDKILRGLKLRKVWVNAIVDDAITVATTGLANNASVASTSTGNNSTDGTQVFNQSGGTVTLPAETFAPGSQANYTTTVACTGATLSGSTPGSTFTMPDNDVTCTYTNTRKSVTLQLLKTWINARLGDAVTVTAAGITNSAGAALNAVADTANETDPGTVVTVYAGEVATLNEGAISGSGETYLTSFSCTGNANPLVGSALTVAASDTAIVCTFVNEWLPPAPPPPPGVTAIPVTSPGGLALMAALLALLGAAATRRRGRN
ncbi:MAG: IPTL-CTERM sorting domain-containing protein [Betaproteobacteria bacterium]|nr:IPTL-CTERM sorting domain-containing protein [Betaproteobacteria bacterium]